MMDSFFFSYEVDKILSEGISLESIGINNWALTQQQALQALDQLLKLQIPVLGGDVHELVKGVLQHNYDNWSCEELPDELLPDYLERSIRCARKYIESYPVKRRNSIFFELVPHMPW